MPLQSAFHARQTKITLTTLITLTNMNPHYFPINYHWASTKPLMVLHLIGYPLLLWVHFHDLVCRTYSIEIDYYLASSSALFYFTGNPKTYNTADFAFSLRHLTQAIKGNYEKEIGSNGLFFSFIRAKLNYSSLESSQSSKVLEYFHFSN